MTSDPSTPVDRSSRSRVAVLVLLAVGAVAGFVADPAPATALAVLALAGIPMVFAVPPRGRPFVGVTLAAVAVLVAMSSWDDLLAALAAASVIVAGVLLAWHGRSWPALARRYDRDGAPAEVDLWRELDSGRDPTADPPA